LINNLERAIVAFWVALSTLFLLGRVEINVDGLQEASVVAFAVTVPGVGEGEYGVGGDSEECGFC
tara:strand:+ start:2589 stop:2783 length:195 start_codon:yes stop_codon:yes gene_type:complete